MSLRTGWIAVLLPLLGVSCVAGCTPASIPEAQPSSTTTVPTPPVRPAGPAPSTTSRRPTTLLDPSPGLAGGDGSTVASAGSGVRTYDLSAQVRAAGSIRIAFTCRGTGELDVRLAGEKIVWGQCSSTADGVIRSAALTNPSLRRATTIEVVAKPSTQWRIAYSTGRTVR